MRVHELPVGRDDYLRVVTMRRLKWLKRCTVTGLVLTAGVGLAGCATAAANDDATPSETAATPVEDSEHSAGASDQLACTAIRSPLSVVQNAATLGGAEISNDTARGMLLSSERQIRDAGQEASSSLAAVITAAADATAALARADESGRAGEVAAVSATQAEVIAACQTAGVTINLDAWVGG